MINYTEKEQLLMLKIIEQDIPYFIMGSKRFEYAKDDSDLDICIYFDRNKPTPDFLKDIETFDFRNVPQNGYSGKDEENTILLHSLKLNVHLLMILNPEDYKEKEEQHRKVETMLHFNPNMRYLIRYLKKEYRLSGKTIYSMLVKGCLNSDEVL